MPEGGARSQYIVSPVYDWVFFLSPPLVALALGIVISDSAFANAVISIGSEGSTGASLAIGALIHAHLVAVFFRSHGNPSVFRRHRVRFVAVPLALFVALLFSPWLGVLALVVATFWDVWHSGAQTFGFGRIYDRNAGAPPEQGRRLDFILNQLLYAGPILAGVTLMAHVEVLEQFEIFEDPVAAFLTWAPVEIEDHRRYLVFGVLGGSSAFLGLYVLRYAQLIRAGYRVSRLKVFLVVTTGGCAIFTWGFNSWGEAFFIMNLFHAVQYLALVWATEHRGFLQRTGLAKTRLGKPIALAGYLGSVGIYGVGVELVGDRDVLWALAMVVSLMHFWYDAFVWSVRKAHV